MRTAVTDWSGIGTVQIAVVTSLAAPVICPTVSATEEAVVVVLIADLVEAHTFRVLHTLRLTNIGVCVTEISDITIVVVPAATDMRGPVTDWSGIGTVQITVVTSLATPVIGAAVSATEEAVVVVLIADLVPAGTEWMIVADLEFTLVC